MYLYYVVTSLYVMHVVISSLYRNHSKFIVHLIVLLLNTHIHSTIVLINCTIYVIERTIVK